MKANEVFPSKYLKADAMKGDDGRYGTMTVTILGVHTSEPFDDGNVQRVIKLDNGKELGLNKTNWSTIASMLGRDDDDDWVGARIELWVDPNVFYAGKKTAAIRVREPAGGCWPSASKGGASGTTTLNTKEAVWADFKRRLGPNCAQDFKASVEAVEKTSGKAKETFGPEEWQAVATARVITDEDIPF